jgi:predicted metal-dependent hydrolase
MTTDMQRIKVSTIDIDVSFKDIKNLHLSVHPPDGRVTLSAPRHFDLDLLRTYAATKLSWIKKEQNKIVGQDRQTSKDFINRESHYFLGKRYLLMVTTGSKPSVILHHSRLELQCLDNAVKNSRESLLYRFYRRELHQLLDKLVARYATHMGISVPKFGIKKMKTKWGSCSIERQYLWFNIELAKKPRECIEYVVVHELAHLFQRHHNESFVNLLDQHFPSWQVQKKILNELPL